MKTKSACKSDYGSAKSDTHPGTGTLNLRGRDHSSPGKSRARISGGTVFVKMTRGPSCCAFARKFKGTDCRPITESVVALMPGLLAIPTVVDGDLGSDDGDFSAALRALPRTMGIVPALRPQRYGHFLCDGEMDAPESRAALTIAAVR